MGSFNRFIGECSCGKLVSFQDKELLYYGATEFESLGGFCPEYRPGDLGPIEDKDCDFPLMVTDFKTCECKGVYVAKFRGGIYKGIALLPITFRKAAWMLKKILGHGDIGWWVMQLKEWYGDPRANTIFISNALKANGESFSISNGKEVLIVGKKEVNRFRLPKPRQP